MAAARHLPLAPLAPLAVLLSPIKKMVAWEEPWDVEDEDEDEPPPSIL